jgi:membrane protein DedA with SNARE-associated domain
MDMILNFIQSVDPVYFGLALWAMVCLTAMALVPGHNDLLLILIVGNIDQFSITKTELFLIFFTAVFIGENLVFLVGKKLGGRVLELKLVKKKINFEIVEKLKNAINDNLLKVLSAHRLSPFLRPQLMLIISALDIRSKDFLKLYFLPLMAVLTCQIFIFGHLGTALSGKEVYLKYLVFGVAGMTWIYVGLTLKKKIL